MNPETKNCQSCQREFAPLPEDTGFYAKIGVAPPSFCFDCRLQRRMAWRNERSLYKRHCNAPGHTEEIVSMYPEDAPFVVYDHAFWWSDGWDALESGADYDFSRPFLAQFSELLKRTPLPSLSILNSVNCEYTNFVDGNKNCYLLFGSGWCENVNYANKVMAGRDCQDQLMTMKCELCYECVNCVECYKVLWGVNSKNCSDSYFLYDCRNCQNCFGCANLVSKSYCIFNEQYDKESYQRKLAEMGIGSRACLAELASKFRKEIYLESIHRYANIINSVNVTGDNINNSKNCKVSFDLFQNAEDANYLYGSLDLKDCYDCNGTYKNSFSYELVDCNVGNRNISDITVYNSNDTAYCINCHSSSNLFGCVGLRSKQYCILNRQYSKEEYETLLPKVLDHMRGMPYKDGKGRAYAYGDFFPIELSPYAYNETLAQEYFSLDPAAAAAAGFPWRQEAEKNYAATLKPADLPDTIAEAPSDITSQVIACAHAGGCQEQCTRAFKIIPAELQFYKQLNVPLPELCPNCRHYARLAQRNPMRLWHRNCGCPGDRTEAAARRNTAAHFHGSNPCPNGFETSYAPERPEIVYCEQCYQAEVA